MDAAMADATEMMIVTAAVDVTGQTHQMMIADAVPQDDLLKTMEYLICQGAEKLEEFLPISKGAPAAVRYRNNRIVF